ncbi:MAG: hypothetical protein Q4F69_02550 [Bacteroidia bacterium]|nr:hypothetical protein [Bacteroidia bacterium]
MATYTVTINERTCSGRELVMRLSNMPEIKFEKMTAKKRKSGLDEALEDVRAGRVTEYESVDDLFEKLGIDV